MVFKREVNPVIAVVVIVATLIVVIYYAIKITGPRMSQRVSPETRRELDRRFGQPPPADEPVR